LLLVNDDVFFLDNKICFCMRGGEGNADAIFAFERWRF
jgi:hypothetical protein